MLLCYYFKQVRITLGSKNVLPATMIRTTESITNDFLLVFLVYKRAIDSFTLSAPYSPYIGLVYVVVLQMAYGGQQNVCTACRRPHIIK